MSLVKPILEIIAYTLSWLAAKGIDAILGKWLAYITAVWEVKASDTAKAAYAAALTEIKTAMPIKSDKWDDWRRNANPTPPASS